MLPLSPSDIGKRLDVFLSEKHADVSRARIQRVVKDGGVTVNGRAVTPHYALREGDAVEVVAEIAAPDADAPLAPRGDIPLDILHHDDAIIVVNKQSGLLVHPDVPGETETLANALVAHFPEIAEVGESRQRPGIMHRLDREASGVLVVARTKPAYDALKKQFHDHVVDKRYLVLVYDAPPHDEGSVDFAIGRKKGSGKMAARPAADAEEGDRSAVTHYKVIERFLHSTLLEVRTETGRTHQIRVHMQALNCPVVGDQLYFNKNVKPIPVGRLFLHAASLAFTHPETGETVRFEAALPKELEDALALLKATKIRP